MMVTTRPLTPDDWPAVEAIYRAGIATGHATFEAEPPTWYQFDESKCNDLRLVAVDDTNTVLGWVAASPTSPRQVYRGVVEHSIYVHPTTQRQGIAHALIDALLTAADTAGYWTIQSSVFPENTVSLALHDAAGFRRIGTRERIALMTYGPKAGTWRDTILIERRRST